MSFEHAEHNESLCKHLVSLTGYNDWVITTAFYSALHFVCNKIFPLEVENVIYKDIDHYSAAMHNSGKSSSEKKHNLTKNLVKSHLNPLNTKYRWLFDTCITARYHNYKIDDDIATKATEYLSSIKEYCLKEN